MKHKINTLPWVETTISYKRWTPLDLIFYVNKNLYDRAIYSIIYPWNFEAMLVILRCHLNMTSFWIKKEMLIHIKLFLMLYATIITPQHFMLLNIVVPKTKNKIYMKFEKYNVPVFRSSLLLSLSAWVCSHKP